MKNHIDITKEILALKVFEELNKAFEEGKYSEIQQKVDKDFEEGVYDDVLQSKGWTSAN